MLDFRATIFIVALLTTFPSISSAQSLTPTAQSQPSYPAPLVINGPIKRWDEGLPLGNGLFGVLVWGEGNTLRLSLDRADLWDTRLPDMLKRPDWTYATMIRLKEVRDHKTHIEMFDKPYDEIPYPTKLPLGRVEIHLPESYELNQWMLIPGTNNVTVGVRASNSTQFQIKIRVHPTEPLVICAGFPSDVKATPVWPTGLKSLNFDKPEMVDCIHGVSDPFFGGRTEWTTREYEQVTPSGLRYAVATCGWKSPTTASQKDRFWVLTAAVKSSAECANPRVAAVDLVGTARIVDSQAWTDAETLYSGPAAFSQSRVTIPDARLQQHYNLCKHFYIAGSRRGAPPIPLQGIWTADEGGLPPWKGDYHNDLNTQMTYCAYAPAGLFDQGLSWIEFNERLMPAYRKFATDFYGIDKSRNAALIPGVMTIDGQPMGGWGQYSLSPTHAAWIAQSFYLHWRYTADPLFLSQRALPFCDAVGEGLLALVKADERGFYKLPLSTSPEIHDNSCEAWLPPNSNYDLSLMRWMFAAQSEMHAAAGDAAAAAKWRGHLEKLEPLDVDAATGLTFAKGHPYNESHRHFSHAMSIFPLGTLSIESSVADRETISKTIDRLHTVGTDWWCGYSFSWMAAMCARAGQSERALDYLTKYLAFTGPNGFHLNGDQTKSGLSKFTYRPFTLEGNFIAMQAMHEMLLQSWGEVGRPDSSIIRIFPAVSEKWKDVRFDDLRAEGGFRVSAERRDGKTRQIRIIAEREAVLRLRDPFNGAEAKWSRIPTQREDGVLELRLGSGEVLEGEPE